ncbi:MAG: radical SAM protein [Elusimicrobiota bacterium]
MIPEDELRRRLTLLPSRLNIYVTNRCNLACAYCAGHKPEHPPRTIPLEDAVRAVDGYASHVSPEVRARCGADPKAPHILHITGGEPLMAYDVVGALVDHVRERHPWMTVSLMTNGTLLDPEKAESLLERGVEVAVSLDGPKGTNDRHRRFHGGRKSVFDTVVGHLSKLPARRLGGMQADIVVTAQTMGSMGESREFVKSLGFGEVCFALDWFEVWTPDKLDALRDAFAAIRKQEMLEALFSSGEEAYPRPSADGEEVGCNRLTPVTRALALSPDGTFFPCFAACLQELREFRIGDAKSGLDFDRLEKMLKPFLARLSSESASNPYSTMNRYCHAVSVGLDPAMMLMGGRRVGKVIEENRQSLQKAYRVLGRFHTDERLGGFRSEPRSKARSEIGFRALDIGPGGESDPGKLRQAMDHCLYSPGDEKELALRAQDVAGAFDLLETAGLYALLKARFLDKRVRLAVEGGVKGLGARQLRFFRDYGVLLGATGCERLEPGEVRRVSEAAGRANIYAVVPLGRSSATNVGERVKGALKKGFEKVKLELRGGDGLWSDAELKALRGASLAAEVLLGPSYRGEQDPRAAEEFGLWLDRMRGSTPVEAAYSGFPLP